MNEVRNLMASKNVLDFKKKLKKNPNLSLMHYHCSIKDMLPFQKCETDTKDEVKWFHSFLQTTDSCNLNFGTYLILSQILIALELQPNDSAHTHISNSGQRDRNCWKDLLSF